MDQSQFEKALLAFVQSENTYQELERGMSSNTFDLTFEDQLAIFGSHLNVKKALELIYPFYKICKRFQFNSSNVSEDYSVIVDSERIVVATCWNMEYSNRIDITLLKTNDLDQEHWMFTS